MIYSRKWTTFAALVVAVSIHANVFAAERALPKDGESSQTELWNAVDSQLVEVRFIPLGNHAANVRIQNLTSKPIDLALPPAFAAVHVNGQFGAGQFGAGQFGGGQFGAGQFGGQQGGIGGGGGLGLGGGGQGQALGGGFGQGGGQNGGLNGGGFNGGFNGGRQPGMFRVPPDGVRKLRVATVCLEHGKPDPNARMAYKIVPAQQIVKDQRVLKLCENLGSGNITQTAAQAAAWHMTDELPWTKLRALNRVESKYTGNIRYFSSRDIHEAQQFVSANKVDASSGSLAESTVVTAETSTEVTSSDQPRQRLSGRLVRTRLAGRE